MKKMVIALLWVAVALLVFAGILAGCVTALLLMIMMVRFPLLLIAVLLACLVFSRLQDIVGKRIG